MATYYVRKSGSDSNAGTSAGAAWLTIGKALGAAGIAAGDTVYIGAGVYRETVTIAMTTSGSTTSVIGDITGAFTGDAGDVVVTPVISDWATASGNTLVCTSKSNLSFSNIVFYVFQSNGLIGASGSLTQGLSFTDCVFVVVGNISPISFTATVDQALDWTFERSVVFQMGASGTFLSVTAPTSSTADYDLNVVLKNCYISASVAVALSTSGALAGKPWGVRISNVTGMNRLLTTNSGVSTTNPCTVTNSITLGTTVSVSANASGQITEQDCILPMGRTNVTAGTRSTAVVLPLLFEVGQAHKAGRRTRTYMEPLNLSAMLGWGGTSVPATDINGLPRPCGTMVFGASGTATAGAAKTLTDSGATWGTNQYTGWMVKITGGTGSGQVKQIASNTGTALTVDGNWVTNPSTDSTYVIYRGAPATSGKATAGAASSVTDGNAAWATNQWTGFTVELRSGTGSGQTGTVASNTATVLTMASAWGVTPDSTSQYWIYRGTDENTVNAAVGCFERGNTMTRSTALARTGSYSLRALGPAVQDFDIPVSAVSTTVTVYVQWDSTYAGTKPSMSVLNGEECGVTAATATATGSAGSWEQLTLTFTPAAAGIVTIRLQSSCTSTLGSAYFDDLAATPAVTPTLGEHTRAGEPIAAVGGVSLMPLAQIFGG